MSNIEIATAAINEATKAGRTEMSIRRTNSGRAGEVARKISNREKYVEDGDGARLLTVQEQAERLAQWLTTEELKHIESYL